MCLKATPTLASINNANISLITWNHICFIYCNYHIGVNRHLSMYSRGAIKHPLVGVSYSEGRQFTQNSGSHKNKTNGGWVWGRGSQRLTKSRYISDMIHSIYNWDMGFTRHNFLYLFHVLALYCKCPNRKNKPPLHFHLPILWGKHFSWDSVELKTLRWMHMHLVV